MKKIILLFLMLLPLYIYAQESEEVNQYIVIKTGESLKLEIPSYIDTAGIQYESTNSSIVSVDVDGVLRANNEGKTTVTATSTDGRKVEYNVEVLGRTSYIFHVIKTFFIDNLLAFVIVAFLLLAFIFVKYMS